MDQEETLLSLLEDLDIEPDNIDVKFRGSDIQELYIYVIPEYLDDLNERSVDTMINSINNLSGPPNNIDLPHLYSSYLQSELKEFTDKMRVYRSDLFTRLSKLEYLDIRDGTLVKLEGDVFVHLEKLKQLKLHAEFLADIPEHVFANLKNIETLELVLNNCKKLPKELIYDLTELKYFSLKSASLDNFNVDFFANSSKLREVNLITNLSQQVCKQIQKRLRISAPQLQNFVCLSQS